MATDCIPSPLTGIPLCPRTAAKRTKHGDCGAGDTGCPAGIQARLPAAFRGLLPALGTRQRETESRSGMTGCVTLQWEKGVQALALLSVQPAPGHSRPLFFMSPQGSRAAQPPQREMRRGWVVLEGEGLQGATQISGDTHSSPRAGEYKFLSPTTTLLHLLSPLPGMGR